MKHSIVKSRSKGPNFDSAAKNKKFSLQNLVTIALETLNLSLISHIIVMMMFSIPMSSLCSSYNPLISMS